MIENWNPDLVDAINFHILCAIKRHDNKISINKLKKEVDNIAPSLYIRYRATYPFDDETIYSYIRALTIDEYMVMRGDGDARKCILSIFGHKKLTELYSKIAGEA